MKIRSTLTSLLIAGSVLMASNAIASDAKGLIVALRGTVIATGAADSRELKQGDEIFVEDSILTAPKSFAVIQFLDGAKVTVKPDSEIVVEDYVYNGNAEDKATLNLDPAVCASSPAPWRRTTRRTTRSRRPLP